MMHVVAHAQDGTLFHQRLDFWVQRAQLPSDSVEEGLRHDLAGAEFRGAA